MRVELPGITVTIAGARASASTTIETAGAYVVIVTTTLPEQPFDLTSCYLGEMQGAAAVSHLEVTARPSARPSQRFLASGPTATTHARSCLLDHLAELRRRLGLLSGSSIARVDVADVALDTAAAAWRPTSTP